MDEQKILYSVIIFLVGVISKMALVIRDQMRESRDRERELLERVLPITSQATGALHMVAEWAEHVDVGTVPGEDQAG